VGTEPLRIARGGAVARAAFAGAAARLAWVACALCAASAASAGCARGDGATARAPGRSDRPAPLARRHAQIVRAATTQARAAAVARLRETAGSSWRALHPDDDVDPFRVFVRRAFDASAAGPAVAGATDADAEAAALAFVSANAASLGLAPSEAAVLDVACRAVPIGERPPGSHARWNVRLGGRFPMRGFEAFPSLATTVDIVVVVDDDMKIRLLVNGSRIHPRLALDTKPDLEPDDPRVLRHVVGRELFVAIADPRAPDARVRELRRRSLGRVRADDVVSRTLTIHASPGPLGAWMTYRLAYVVRVAIRLHGPGELAGAPPPTFRFVVDADTGELIDDAAVPVVSGGGEGEL
jgi:hypothetical protein